MDSVEASHPSRFSTDEKPGGESLKPLPALSDQYGNISVEATALFENGKEHEGKPTAGTSATQEKKGRNLIVCIDGTANQFGTRNTHVVELFSRLVADENQLKYYNSGIATYVAESSIFVRAKQKVKHWVDMAIAIGHAQITLKAYQWLSENYIPGDRIYLFGFSRGAYQVRIIAGMIHVVGLLQKGNNEQIPFAYQLYLAKMKVEERKRKVPSLPLPEGTDDHTEKVCDKFKNTLSNKNLKVHFVGVWDTVSSIGATRGPSFPETIEGMLHVRAFRHALALHELRIKFLPEYGRGAAGPVLDRAGKPVGDVKEVWFLGSHSDIGGGNAENIELNGFGPPLRWMLYEAVDHGVRIEASQEGWNPPAHHPSMSSVWRMFEALPFKRLSYNGKKSTSTTYRPHRSAGRYIQPGQLIHASVKEHLEKHEFANCAHALIKQNESWIPLSRYLANGGLIGVEEDIHTRVVEEITGELSRWLTKGEILPVPSANRLLRLFEHPISQKLIFDNLKGFHSNPNFTTILLNALEDPLPGNNVSEMSTMATAILNILTTFPARPQICEIRPIAQLSALLQYTNATTVSRVIDIFCAEKMLTGHAETVAAVAYSPNAKFVASGSLDKTIRLWDAQTGHTIGEPLRGHTGFIRSVAFSPDGSHLATSAINDCSIWIWDVAAQQTVGSPLTGHDQVVHSVAFLPDGKHVVSGSGDKTVRIWDMETGHAVGDPLRGHTNCIRSVAVSPDGRQIASGAGSFFCIGGADYTVRIWDFEKHEVVRVLQGHSEVVESVVFMPDSKHVVSGSDDGSIRVWDVESGKTVLGPLRGHRQGVVAVAVSSNGKYIVSGSHDKTVRLWSAETGEAVGEPLRGHTSGVTSVVFSPDSRRVVSGSFDKTLIIWEVDCSSSTTSSSRACY